MSAFRFTESNGKIIIEPKCWLGYWRSKYTGEYECLKLEVNIPYRSYREFLDEYVPITHYLYVSDSKVLGIALYPDNRKHYWKGGWSKRKPEIIESFEHKVRRSSEVCFHASDGKQCKRKCRASGWLLYWFKLVLRDEPHLL